MKKCLSIISIVLVFVFCLCGCKKTGKYNSSVIESNNASSETSSELTVAETDDCLSSLTESKNTTSKDTSSKENSSINSNKSDSSLKDNSSKASSKPQTIESKPSTSSSMPASPDSSTTEKKDYLDTSLLTYTQDDVGKVIGYSSAFNQDITVLYVKEGTDAQGLTFIKIQFYPTGNTTIKQCKYCHEFPCPDGGGTDCAQYSVKEDASVTCPQCFKPVGDGYNGTCDTEIDWINGGSLICNHYD